MYNCAHCFRSAETINSHKNHESRCKENPDRKLQGFHKDNKGRIPRKTSCLKCKEEIQNFYFDRHKCKQTIGIPENLKCTFCSEECKSSSSYRAHVSLCNLNPVSKWFGHQNKTYVKKGPYIWTNDKRLERSHKMKEAVKRCPESYTSSNRGRTKQILVDGIKLQGQWEVDFYNWAKSANLSPIRSTESFPYEWNGERLYHPDFYIPSLDLYIEVKGYETDRDRAKWLHFPKNLAIIKSKQIQEIRKGVFKGLM